MKQLTESIKLEALSLKFYQGWHWSPKVGDLYTICRADLELFEITRIEDGQVWIGMHTEDGVQEQESPWDLEGFTTEGHRRCSRGWSTGESVAPSPLGSGRG